MTIDEKKAWLNRYREAEKLFQRLTYRLEEARTAARRTTQSFSPTPSGSGDGQSLARAVEREEEAERKAYAQLAVCDALFEEINAALETLNDNREYIVLRKYYLNGLTWEQIAEDTDCSTRWVYILSRNALEHLEI